VALELSSEEIEVAILSRLDGLTQRELADLDELTAVAP
jgi:hypothetical protein